jgi:UDP-2,4-diacetamido-2,4,6-trideoxy-beta-L-altropyranose hydrolase
MMQSLTIAFRVDASIEIGTGHLMRCLTLAKQLKRQNHSIIFICRKIPKELKHSIADQHSLILLSPSQKTIQSNDYSTWLGDTQENDATETLKVLKKSEKVIDWMIVDHYGIDSTWEKLIKSTVNNVMVVDDLANRQHDCEFLLDQTYGRTNNAYLNLIHNHCFTFLGSRYSLLRDEFDIGQESIINKRRSIDLNNLSILVMFGGIDQHNLSQSVTDLILTVPTVNNIKVVLSRNAIHADRLRTYFKDNTQVEILIDPKAPNTIANIMLSTDIAVGASGTTSWERCAMGLPSIAIIEAENQRNIALNLESIGAIKIIEREYIEQQLEERILEWQKDLTAYMSSVNSCLSICDSKGAYRIARALENNIQLNIRKTEKQDMDIYYEWANDPSVRKHSLSQDSIPLPSHQKWFSNKLNSNTCLMYIGFINSNDTLVGQVRFEEENALEFTVHISLAPTQQGKGFGPLLLFQAIQALINDKGEKISLTAIIVNTNRASKQCFVQNHFDFDEELIINDLSCSKYTRRIVSD